MRLDKAVFVVFDVETTGLYPYSGDKICEIGALRVERGARIKKFHSLINPERPISYSAFSVNGITDEMVQNKPTIEEIMPDFLDFIKGSVLVAYNAGFDLGFIECALGGKTKVLKDYYVIDALILARRLFPGIGRYNLGSVCASLGISQSGEHRALSDATMTWSVFKKELDMLSSEGINSVEDIARIRKKKEVSAGTVKEYKVKLIEEAIRRQKKLDITYHSVWNGMVTKRIITPKELRHGYDKSYIIAHCHLKNAERNFRLDCIVEAKPHREAGSSLQKYQTAI